MKTIMPTKRARRAVRKDEGRFVDDRDLAPFPTPCPDWCTVGAADNKHVRHLEYEPWEAKGHPQRREHDGPIFGAFQVMGREWLSEPGQIALHVHGTPRTESAADLR